MTSIRLNGWIRIANSSRCPTCQSKGDNCDVVVLAESARRFQDLLCTFAAPSLSPREPEQFSGGRARFYHAVGEQCNLSAGSQFGLSFLVSSLSQKPQRKS